MLLATAWGQQPAPANLLNSRWRDRMGAPHPLDPLTAAEFGQVVAVLRRDRGVGAHWRFASIEVVEPSKDAWLAMLASAEKRRLMSLWKARCGCSTLTAARRPAMLVC